MNNLNSDEFINLNAAELENERRKIYARLMEVGPLWAEAKSIYDGAKNKKAVQLATIQDAYSELGLGMSKVKALVSPEYKAILDLEAELQNKYLLLDAEYKALLGSYEVLKTIGFVRNSELKLARYD